MNTDRLSSPRRKRPFFVIAALLLLFLLLCILLLLAGSGNSGSGSGDGSGSGSAAAGSGTGTGTDGTGSGSGAGSGKDSGAGTGATAPGSGKEASKAASGSTAKTETAGASDQGESPDSEGDDDTTPPQRPDTVLGDVVKPKTAPAQDSGNDKKGDGSASGRSGKEGFYGLKLRGNVLFIVDVSGSMGAPTAEQLSRIDILKAQLKNSLETGHRNENARRNRYSIIAFSSGVKTFPAKGQKRFNDIKDAKDFCQLLDANGGTDMMQAWMAAVQLLADRSNKVDTIYFLSDGEPTDCNIGDLVRFVHDKIDREIVIHTITIGLHSEGMKQIAETHGGKYTLIR